MSKTPVSREGMIKLKNMLTELKGPRMKEMLETLKDARESSSELSENSEYEAAKEAHDMLNLQISKLERDISNSVVVDMDTINTDTVQLFTKVKVMNNKIKKQQEFQIVSETEINIKEGKISYNSPIGSSLINKKVGDVVSVNAPAGKMELEILNISI